MPGQTRWAVLQQFLEEAGLIAFSNANGKELFIGQANQQQPPQYLFATPGSESLNQKECNFEVSISEDISELYSRYVVVGAGQGGGANYGTNAKFTAELRDNPDERDGTGNRFLREKLLIIQDDGIRNQVEARERVAQEKAQREAHAQQISVRAAGHSQLYSGTVPAIFAVDTMAKVVDEDTGTRGDYYVTACDYERSRSGGTTTSLSLVPKGTSLQL